ncbi:M15 family metallopeptidase [Halalkalibacillus halophilus]|uniref:M15 family metallopeptidase n=1 Tax=Halalkalibacillus halophilus TaxID=392827 RepID=UPI0003F6E8B8|nr:M15 family metallopeptidase [Halalkalibacillus halophilus]
MLRSKYILIGIMLISLILFVACNDSEEPASEEPAQEENEDSEENESDETESDREEEEESEENDSTDENEEASTEEEDQDEPVLSYEEDLLDQSSITALVNKQYSLDEDYVPEDLVTIDVPNVLENPEINQLREEANDALTEMFADAEESGIILYARSGYRSYHTQEQLFTNSVEANGEEHAMQYSAQPGHSEHQTGLAMDVTSESVNYQLTADFGETEEGTWVRENAHEFGYIIRYTEGDQDITGYNYEPWHLRYLGEEIATLVYESGLTYEEFLIEEGIDIEVAE